MAYEFQHEFGSAFIIVARMGEGRGCIGSWWGNRRERDHWGDLGVEGWIILERISGGGMWVYGLDWADPG